MKERIQNWWNRNWNEYNPEGLRGKDAFFMFWFVVIGLLFMANLMFWCGKPEQEWIGHLLFPMR